MELHPPTHTPRANTLTQQPAPSTTSTYLFKRRVLIVVEHELVETADNGDQRVGAEEGVDLPVVERLARVGGGGQILRGKGAW